MFGFVLLVATLYDGDARVRRAVALLGPEDRPTVPVVVVQDVQALYRRRFGRAADPRVEAVYDDGRIYVNARSGSYRDRYKLASVLAHEQVHARGVVDEGPARRRQLEVLRAFGRRVDRGYVEAVESTLRGAR
jgi:hypothetical protein